MSRPTIAPELLANNYSLARRFISSGTGLVQQLTNQSFWIKKISVSNQKITILLEPNKQLLVAYPNATKRESKGRNFYEYQIGGDCRILWPETNE